MKYLLLTLLLAQCSTTKPIKPLEPQQQIQTYAEQEIGNISYYSYSCNRCRITGNGSVFDTSLATIAYYNPKHNNKYHYYGCEAVVINLNTGDSIDVVITDSGEFRDSAYAHKHLILDATPYVFRKLGFTKRQGIGKNVLIKIKN